MTVAGTASGRKTDMSKRQVRRRVDRMKTEKSGKEHTGHTTPPSAAIRK